ncbi:MAG: hypothetical protein HY043_18290 [Verrucomicrobia bacterium]|nr:hypothetical protein [Verrucomicrobiota bacterium]
MRTKELSASLIAGFALTLCGCGETRWEEHAIDGPWVAPGVHARESMRTRLFFYAPLPEHVIFWTNAKGRRVETYNIVDASVRYLEELGYFDRWPKAGLNMNGYDSRVAPFTFHIVAIEPTVIVMTPQAFRSKQDVLSYLRSGSRTTGAAAGRNT